MSISILDNNLGVNLPSYEKDVSSNNKKDLIRIAEDRKITKFDYNSFENIKPIASGGF
ncbi:9544_t:CDS:1, partial [Diversispora eburnea]